MLCGTQADAQADAQGAPRPSLWIVWKQGGRRDVLKTLLQDAPPGDSVTLEDLRVIDDTTFRFTLYDADLPVYYELNLASAALTVLGGPDN